MTVAALAGGCFCGRSRYALVSAPLSVGLCHCRSCRRATGATPVGWATYPTADVRFAADARGFHTSPGGAVWGFCTACGTTITYADDAATLDVTLATLDDPGALVPTRETWLSHRIGWVAIGPERAGFAGRPD